MAKLSDEQRMRKAFAEERTADNVSDEYEKLVKKYPWMAEKISPEDFVPEDIKILSKSNFEICEYIAFKDDDSQLLEFDPSRTMSVASVVKTNILAYKNFKRFYEAETDKDSAYAKTYAKLIRDFEPYFDKAAEDMLVSFYGKDYMEFREQWYETKRLKKEEAAAKKQAKKPKQTEE